MQLNFGILNRNIKSRTSISNQEPFLERHKCLRIQLTVASDIVAALYQIALRVLGLHPESSRKFGISGTCIECKIRQVSLA